MTEQTLQLIYNLLEAWNSHDPARVAAWYTEDCYGLDVAIARPQIGREGVQAMFAAYYHAFPDLEITPDDAIVDGDQSRCSGQPAARTWGRYSTSQPVDDALSRVASTAWCCRRARCARR